ncbi:MAG: phosphonoacetaldehyde hydrolase [Pirellulaceae bacterium]|nr:phosphonoacetaldehyde hydrolase [Pirellulaceae bacterium]
MQCQHLKAVVFDWAGTMIDYGSCAPAVVFQQIFQTNGIRITPQQAREPMGMAKREHIATIGAMPEVAAAWQNIHGRPLNVQDVDRMYQQFLPLQKEVLGRFSELIPGAAEAEASCRELGLKVGSTTGYTRELMESVTAAAARQGYRPDFVLCSEDAPRGRPAPYLLFEAAKRLDVFPMWRVVNVDDTTAGVEAGRNAGCWNIGISKSGNLVGLSQAELDCMDQSIVGELCKQAERKLVAAGAHYVVPTVAQVPEVLRLIEQRCHSGQRTAAV